LIEAKLKCFMTDGTQSSVDDNKLIKILVIDDDQKLCRLIKEYLEPLGYQVHAAFDGQEGLRKACQESYDAIILDVMLPGLDGIEVLKRIRQKSNVPVLMFTARGEEPDRIVGLEIGADDYIPKTCSTRELLARLRAVIRRTGSTSKPDKDSAGQKEIVIGELRILPGPRIALLNENKLELTPVEFDLLESLALAKGRVKTRDQLMEEIRDRDYDGLDRSVDVHISALRKKLGDDPKSPKYIKTVRSVGYMMVDPNRPFDW